jgi:hypothetical protein
LVSGESMSVDITYLTPFGEPLYDFPREERGSAN